MECPNCHHWNEAGSRFCEECGFELTSVEAAPAKVSITGGVSPAAMSPTLPPAPAPTMSPSAAPSMPAAATPSFFSSPPAPADVPEPPPQTLVPSNAAPAPSVTYSGARLVLDATGSVFKLGDATLVGREDPSLQIDFDGYQDGKYISHRHAQITKHDGAFFVEDLGSSNHTRVNGAKLSVGQSHPLHEGDKVRFGKLELTFHEQ